ncbi:MAG: RluA family pseudouridine synthase [Phycisphaeraceae bacterium]
MAARTPHPPAEFEGDEFPQLPEEFDQEGAERLRFVLARDARVRLDKHLQNRLRHISRNKVQELIELGGVTVNGARPKASTKLKEGDVIDVILPPRPTRELVPEAIPLDILYEDEHFIVINKQADIIVHPARGQMTGTLLNALAWHFTQARGERASHADGSIEGLSHVGADDARPGIVHRLDRHTTGVIVVGKQDEAHWKLARQFEHRTNLKVYLAIVHGCPDPPGGVIEQPIGKHPIVREAMAVRHDPSAKEAVTLYRVRERYEGYSLVELELKSGRTHQIRVHLQYLGYPIVGDLLYGGEPVGTPELEEPPLPAGYRPNLTYARPREEGDRLEQQVARRRDLIMAVPALHATMLGITHPITDQWMTFTAPVPSPMRDLVRELRKRPADGPVAEHGTWIDLEQALPREES